MDFSIEIVGSALGMLDSQEMLVEFEWLRKKCALRRFCIALDRAIEDADEAKLEKDFYEDAMHGGQTPHVARFFKKHDPFKSERIAYEVNAAMKTINDFTAMQCIAAMNAI